MIAEQIRNRLADDPRSFLAELSAEDRYMEKLAEAIDLANSIIDPTDAYRNGNETWLPIGRGFTGVGSGVSGNMGLGLLTSGFDTELELAMARDEMRYLAGTNPYAINAGENRVSYIVGDGHTYDVALRKQKNRKKKSGDKAESDGESDSKVEAAQAAIDAFVEENDWNTRQQETVERLDRDGEVFLRLFSGDDGVLRVRFVEPGHVQTPPGQAGNPDVRFGIRFDPEDAETAVGYFIKGEEVPASQIQHRKANVDRTTPRGVPLMFGIRQFLRRASKNVLNISAKIDVISAISLIRKHSGRTASSVSSLLAGNAQTQRTDTASGQTVYGRRFNPGTILDTDDKTSYEAPTVDGVDQLAAGVALNLRCIASRLVMPEFMVSSDASNANYASTMVAEGPSVKQFEKLQKRQSQWDMQLMWKAIEAAGVGEAKELKRELEIRVGMPTIVSRDDLKKAQENQIYFDEGILSPQEWSSQIGVDYEKNQAEIKEHQDEGRAYGPGEPSGAFGAGDPLDADGKPIPPAAGRPPNPNRAVAAAALKAKAEGALPEEMVHIVAECLAAFAESEA
jgi:hypothetical protein